MNAREKRICTNTEKGQVALPLIFCAKSLYWFISSGFLNLQSTAYFTMMVGTVTVVSPQVMEVDLISGSSLTPIL